MCVCVYIQLYLSFCVCVYVCVSVCTLEENGFICQQQSPQQALGMLDPEVKRLDVRDGWVALVCMSITAAHSSSCLCDEV